MFGFGRFPFLLGGLALVEGKGIMNEYLDDFFRYCIYRNGLLTGLDQ